MSPCGTQGTLPTAGSSIRVVTWGRPRGCHAQSPSSRTHRHSQIHTVHYVRPNGTHGGHAEALRRCLPLFSTLPQQAEVTLLQKTLKQAIEETTGAIGRLRGTGGLMGGSTGPCDAHLSAGGPHCRCVQRASPPTPISTKAQPQRARSLSHGPGHSGPVVRRSVTRGKGDQESSDTQDCRVTTLGLACQTDCPLPPPSITCPAAQPCADCRDGSPGPSLPHRHPCAVLNTEPVNLPARYAHSDALPTKGNTRSFPAHWTGNTCLSRGQNPGGRGLHTPVPEEFPSLTVTVLSSSPSSGSKRPAPHRPILSTHVGGCRICPVSKPTGCAAGEASPPGQTSSIPLILSTLKPHTGSA